MRFVDAVESFDVPEENHQWNDHVFRRKPVAVQNEMLSKKVVQAQFVQIARLIPMCVKVLGVECLQDRFLINTDRPSSLEAREVGDVCTTSPRLSRTFC